MPCSSEHMKQTGTEAYNQRTAQLYIYALEKMSAFSKIDKKNLALAKSEAHDSYARVDFTQQLCDLLRDLSPEQIEQVVYNARDPMSRKLADWWEEHQDADQKREAQNAKISKWSEQLRDQPITAVMITQGMQKVKELHGVHYAKHIVKEFGKVEKVADIPGNRYHWVYAAIQVSLGEV